MGGSAAPQTKDPPPSITKRTLQPHQILKLQTDIKTKLAAWNPGPAPAVDAATVGDRLRDITKITVMAVPQAPIPQLKHKKCRGGWSPTLMALDAKVTAITSVAYRVRG